MSESFKSGEASDSLENSKRSSRKPTTLRKRRIVFWVSFVIAILALSGVATYFAPQIFAALSVASTQTKVDSLISNGLVQAGAGQVDAAVTTFNQVLTLDSQNVIALYDLGVIMQQKGNLAEATKYYDRALTADPTFTSAMFNKAIILTESSPDSAIFLYEKIVKIKPDASTAYYNLSILYKSKGETTLAENALNMAVKIDPTLVSNTAIPSPSPSPRKP